VSPPNLRQLIASIGLCLALAACGQGKSPVKIPNVKLPNIQMPGHAPFDADRLEGAIDAGFGGRGACVIIAETGSGREVYRYNSNAACMNPLPPCSSFNVANTLIGLDAGLITPTTVYKWDGSPQPVASWQKDTDLKTAFGDGVTWWFQRLAQAAGSQLYQQRLKAFDYGNKSAGGPLTSFWLGPASGGQLQISPREQAQFMHRLFAGRLDVKPASLAAVEQLMQDETRGDYVISGDGGDCPSLADGSQRISWWVGRLKGPKSDYVFAASLQQTTDAALPAEEVKVRAKSAFAQAGLWPAE
jgi:beta-lactamase class D